LGIFQNAWVFWKFYIDFNLMVVNFPDAWVSGKFPKCLGMQEISQVLEYLGISSDF